MNDDKRQRRSSSMSCGQVATLGILTLILCGVGGTLVYLIVTSGSLTQSLSGLLGQASQGQGEAAIQPPASTSAPSTTPGPVSGEPPTVVEMTPDNAWQVFLDYAQFLKDHDLEGVNSVTAVDRTGEWEDCIAGLGELACWGIIEAAVSMGIGIELSELTIVWGDDTQLILSSEPDATMSDEGGQQMKTYTIAQILFVRGSDGKIKLVSHGSFSSSAASSPEGEQTLQEHMKDSDQDGVTDDTETCSGYDPFCGPVTDPLNRDTDGDGYWDGIEAGVETDPTDPNSRPG